MNVTTPETIVELPIGIKWPAGGPSCPPSLDDLCAYMEIGKRSVVVAGIELAELELQQWVENWSPEEVETVRAWGEILAVELFLALTPLHLELALGEFPINRAFDLELAANQYVVLRSVQRVLGPNGSSTLSNLFEQTNCMVEGVIFILMHSSSQLVEQLMALHQNLKYLRPWTSEYDAADDTRRDVLSELEILNRILTKLQG